MHVVCPGHYELAYTCIGKLSIPIIADTQCLLCRTLVNRNSHPYHMKSLVPYLTTVKRSVRFSANVVTQSLTLQHRNSWRSRQSHKNKAKLLKWINASILPPRRRSGDPNQLHKCRKNFELHQNMSIAWANSLVL